MRARRGVLLVIGLGLGLGACGDLLPPLASDGSGSTGPGMTTLSAMTSTGGPMSTTAVVDDGISSTSGSTMMSDSGSSSSGSSTGLPPAECGNGMIEPGEICYLPPEVVAQFGETVCDIAIEDLLPVDGAPELIVQLCPFEQLRIYEGSGDGLTSELTVRELGGAIEVAVLRTFAVGQFMGDDGLDVVVPETPPALVVIPEIERDPIMTTTIQEVPVWYQHLLSVELNDDGNTDLLAAIGGFEEIRVFTGAGNDAEPFVLGQLIDPPSNNYEAKLANIDGMHGPELILMTTSPPAHIEVYPNAGAGFLAMHQLNVPSLIDVTAAQLDGRANLELLATQIGLSGVLAFSTGDDQTFEPKSEMIALGPGVPSALAAADLDDDGFDDLVSIQQDAGQIVAASRNVDGTSFETLETYPIDDRGAVADNVDFLRLIDVNADGVEDIIIVTGNSVVFQVLSDP